MMIRGHRFNIYLLAALAAAVLSGCQSDEYLRKRQLSTLRIHMEAAREGPDHAETVPVYREHPVSVPIIKTPILTEANVTEADVVDDHGGFVLRIKFDRQGTWLLEQYTSENRGRHFAIFSEFVHGPRDKKAEGRWLAAPKISQRITAGVLSFTPDATREEAVNIALGLSNIARKSGRDPRF
jgi:preprotein translocase subunit SecD